MDASTLAVKMLEWETTQRAADALRAEIEAAVLEVGKTQTVGNVRATYSNGRKSYDYEAAVIGYADEAADNDDAQLLEYIQRIKALNSKVVYDFKKITEDLDLEAPVKSQSEPSVMLKLLA